MFSVFRGFRLTYLSVFRGFRWTYLLMLIGAIGAWYSANACQRSKEHYSVGLVTWIGYSPIYIARDKHFFEDEGLAVDVKILDSPGAREAAYQAGQLDFFPNTPDAFAIFFSERSPKGKMVAALDESEGADGVIAKSTIATFRDLKGKKVGFQSGITSHFLLLYLLARNNLSGKDITQVDLSAGDAGQAFIAGKLDAAVTWEPWLSEARKTPNAKVLATSADTPGIIVDVLLTSDRALAENDRPLKAFMRAWYGGISFIKKHPEEAHAIIAKALNVTKPEVRKMLTTTNFFSADQSYDYLQHKLPGVLHSANDLFFENHVIRVKANLESMIDASALRTQP